MGDIISKHDTWNASNYFLISALASWSDLHWRSHSPAEAVPLRWRSKSFTVIALSWCLCRQTAPLLHQHLCKLPGHSLILNYHITQSNWTIWSLWGLGLALSQKFFLPCTIWWDKCNGISVQVCAWVVPVAFLMMLRLSQNKWKYLSDAPWKERWGKKQSLEHGRNIKTG